MCISICAETLMHLTANQIAAGRPRRENYFINYEKQNKNTILSMFFVILSILNFALDQNFTAARLALYIFFYRRYRLRKSKIYNLLQWQKVSSGNSNIQKPPKKLFEHAQAITTFFRKRTSNAVFGI